MKIINKILSYIIWLLIMALLPGMIPVFIYDKITDGPSDANLGLAILGLWASGIFWICVLGLIWFI